jgi:protein-tyrosine phosphatase
MQQPVSSELSRHLPLPGTYNVRDIGGYRTPGTNNALAHAFRADSLHRLPPEAQVRLLDHGVRTVIGLRRGELEPLPTCLPPLRT